MYAELLRRHGVLPVPISTARDGLAVAAKADLIVTDLLLPGDMDGIEFIRRLKGDERTRKKPVIVLTACVWATDHKRADEAGCDLFIPLPCLPDDFLRKARRLLAATRRRDIGERSLNASRARA
jgi:CheY-like chemotaxis protein